MKSWRRVQQYKMVTRFEENWEVTILQSVTRHVETWKNLTNQEKVALQEEWIKKYVAIPRFTEEWTS